MRSLLSSIRADFGFGEDEVALRDMARKVLDEHMPVERLRLLVAGDHEASYVRGEQPGWDAALWKQLVELGWCGLAVPEAHGGAGISLAGIAGVVEEVGRHALPSPLLSTLCASFVLREAGDAAAPFLARIAEGATAPLAIAAADGRWEPEAVALEAREDEGGALCMSGSAFFVQDAKKAELLVATARLGDASVLVAIETDAPGVHVEADHIHDLTRDQATVRCEGVRLEAGAVLSRDAEPVLRAAWPALLVTVAADLCGCSEWQLQSTVEYAKTRKQFDRPIGFFQAVKHPLVDAMIAIDRARSLLYAAAAAADARSEDALRLARMAKSAASDAGAFVSDRAIQLHGGIGFTWECDQHIFFKRSLHGQALFGDGAHQRRRLADLLIGPIGGATSETHPEIE